MNSLAPTIATVNPSAVAIITDVDIEALLSEVYGKPNLGVEDSAGTIDDAATVAYAQGQADYAEGIYWPGSLTAPAFESYLMGWNDSYAAANNVKLYR